MHCKQIIKNASAAGLIFLLFQPALTAQQTAKKFVQETQYLLSLPEGYTADTTKKWPLMIFLHGSGERGDNLEKVKAHGPPKLIEAGKKFPFIVVSPQAKLSGGWEAENLYHLISSIKETYQVDKDRVYLTGLSMGGYGTWALAMKYPQEFAAIIPICGGGDTTDAWKLRHIPIWCFHGALDDVVPPSRDQMMVDAAERYNPSVKFTIYPDANHNSWERTYNNDSVYDWLLQHKKFSYKQVAVSPSVIKQYAGKYVGADKDTVLIMVEHDSLKAKTHNQFFQLKPAGDNLFFIMENLPIDIRFNLNPKGKVESFLLMEDRKVLFRKI
ncbi:MAG: Alpha/beta hydrolase family protein [Ferruginibacter sp.]|nr:Alpha/beta hydrolase family protein [Ferruginibacter sp.]